jgi:hypothetical protein
MLRIEKKGTENYYDTCLERSDAETFFAFYGGELGF